MRRASLPEPDRDRNRRDDDPVPIGELLGLALPSRFRRAMLDLDFLRALWNRAAPDRIAAGAAPVRVEKRVLTIVTGDPAIRAEAHRRRAEIARNLVRAAGLPDARLRVRVELGDPLASANASRRGARES